LDFDKRIYKFIVYFYEQNLFIQCREDMEQCRGVHTLPWPDMITTTHSPKNRFLFPSMFLGYNDL
jgi:hypothetical protein